MTICPNHRSKLGIGWSRGSSTRCRVPEEISCHGKEKGVWPKGERGLGKKESEVILQKTGSFVQVGSGKFYFLYLGEFGWFKANYKLFLRHSGICRKCRGRLKELTVTEDPSQMSTSFNINDEMERMTLVSIRCLTWLEKYCFATSLGLVIELKGPLSAKLRNMQICLFQWHRDHENLLYCELKLTSTGAVNLR